MAALPPPEVPLAADAGPAAPGAGRERGLASDPPARDALPVKVGQVVAEGGRTGVHIVVINMLESDAREVEVRCEARDAQGMQVGGAGTRIDVIAKADVAFGNVLFPSALTAANSRFSCVTSRFADPGGAGR